MLRITTVSQTAIATTLKVEGRLVMDWVPELEAACTRQRANGRQLVLDFADVLFVDRRGARAVTDLVHAGIRVENCRTLVQELLNDAARHPPADQR
jgi:anti-anti-sigma regulatory factor